MDTIVQECKKCFYVTDCIEELCLDCRLEMERIEELETLKQQRDDLLAACKKGVAPFSLSQYAERFRDLASKPNLAVYRVIMGNAAGMFEILESEAKNREAAIAKCEA